MDRNAPKMRTQILISMKSWRSVTRNIWSPPPKYWFSMNSFANCSLWKAWLRTSTSNQLKLNLREKRRKIQSMGLKQILLWVGQHFSIKRHLGILGKLEILLAWMMKNSKSWRSKCFRRDVNVMISTFLRSLYSWRSLLLRVSFIRCSWVFTMRLTRIRVRLLSLTRQRLSSRSMQVITDYLERNWFRKSLSTLVLKSTMTSSHLWWRGRTIKFFRMMYMKTSCLSSPKRLKNTFNSRISTPTWRFSSWASFSPAWKNVTPTTISFWCRTRDRKKLSCKEVLGLVEAWAKSRGCSSASKRAWAKRPLLPCHPRNIRLC